MIPDIYHKRMEDFNARITALEEKIKKEPKSLELIDEVAKITFESQQFVEEYASKGLDLVDMMKINNLVERIKNLGLDSSPLQDIIKKTNRLNDIPY